MQQGPTFEWAFFTYPGPLGHSDRILVNKSFSRILLFCLFSLSGCAELARLEFEEGEGIFSLRSPDPQKDSPRWGHRSPSLEESVHTYQQESQWQKEIRDVTLGQSMHEVTRVWGHPQTIEYADHPWSGNQRWVYPRHGVMPHRVVYFEAGTVTGWESP